MLLVLIKCMHTACTSATEGCQQLMAMKCKSSCVRTDIYSYVYAYCKVIELLCICTSSYRSIKIIKCLMQNFSHPA